MVETTTPMVVVAVGTGASDHMTLPPGEYTLFVSSPGWGDADLQVGDGVSFGDATDSTGVVNFTDNSAVVVAGGLSYRLNVTTIDDDITMVARQANI